MHKPTFWACLLLTCSVMAQTDINVGLQQGYVHNIFKNPSSWTPSEGTSLSPSQLLQSSMVTAVDVELDYDKKWKRQRLGLSADVTGELFPSLRAANLLDVTLKQSFEQRLTKQLYFYQKAGVRSKNRQGSDVAEDLFILPNAYRQLDYLGGLRWKPNRSYLIKVEAGRLHKVYQDSETSALRYDATHVKLYHRYRFSDTKYLQRWTNTLRFQNRWFERERFTEEEVEDFEELDNIDIYDMKYFVLDSEVRYEFGEAWSLTPSVEWTRRGSGEERLRYWQIEPMLKVAYEHDKWTINGRASFAYRKNPFLEPPGTEDPLLYRYASFGATINYQLNDRWAWTTSCTYTQRWSSFDDDSRRAYRPYQFWRAVSGVRLTF